MCSWRAEALEAAGLRLREGLVVEADYYLDRAAALEAAGLSE